MPVRMTAPVRAANHHVSALVRRCGSSISLEAYFVDEG